MRTSASQFAVMVDFMERNGDLAKPQGGPRGRQWAAMKWQELAMRLNSDGSGETRSEEKWRKVWTDYKNNTKRKRAKLNRSMTGTGGGPALKMFLTDLELRVLSIMGEQAATGMTTVPEVGFDHTEQEVVLGPVPSPKLDRHDEDWNHPGTSQEQQPYSPLTPAVAPDVAPTAALRSPRARKWNPQPKSKQKKIKDELMAERECDDRYFELERERLRQRDVELDLQYKWLEFMNEALRVLKKFMGEKNREE